MQRCNFWWVLLMNHDCAARLEPFFPGHQRETYSPTSSWSFPVFCFDSVNRQYLQFVWWASMCCEYPTGFPQGASPTGIPPISPHRQHHLLWMKTALWRGCWRWFLHLPTISPVPHYSQSLTVHTPLTTCLQAERFPDVSEEKPMWEWGQVSPAPSAL